MQPITGINQQNIQLVKHAYHYHHSTPNIDIHWNKSATYDGPPQGITTVENK